MKLINKTFISRLTFSHMLERFQQDPVKIPVDQIIFILKIPVKCLPCRSAFCYDFFYRNLFYRHLLHTVFHSVRQTVFHFIMFCFFQLYHPQLEYFCRPLTHVPHFIHYILIKLRFVAD